MASTGTKSRNCVFRRACKLDGELETTFNSIDCSAESNFSAWRARTTLPLLALSSERVIVQNLATPR